MEDRLNTKSDVPRAATRTAMDAAANDGFPLRSPDYREGFADAMHAMNLVNANNEAALLAANAELARVREELAYFKTYVVPEKDKHGRYWHDLAQKRIVDTSAERGLADDLAKALEKTHANVSKIQPFGEHLFWSESLRGIEAALERHRGARGT